jgi:hypothetical protein
MVGWGSEDVVPIIITTQLIPAVKQQMDVITVNGNMIDHTAVVRSVQQQLPIKRKAVGIVLHGFFGTTLTNWKQNLVAIPIIFILFVKSSCHAPTVGLASILAQQTLKTSRHVRTVERILILEQ